MEILLNQATFRKKWTLEQFLDATSDRGLHRVSIWRDDVKPTDVAELSQLLNRAKVQLFGYNRVGPIRYKSDADFETSLEDGERQIDIAAQLGADHILFFTGGLEPGSKDLAGFREKVSEAAKHLSAYAQGAGTVLAIEPLHPMLCGDRTCLTSLKQANDLCDNLGDGAAIVIDVHHVWWDPDLSQQIQRSGEADRIVGFHVNDWLVPTTHLLTDRGMMGDGVIELRKVWDEVSATGYSGSIEVEIFSERWWERDPDEVYDICLSRCRSIFS